MVICIKQHLSNIWSSILEEVKQHWGWVEKKKALLIKKVCIGRIAFCLLFAFYSIGNQKKKKKYKYNLENEINKIQLI